MSVEGKVVLITGGGTGIGEAAAMLLAQDGASVIVMGRRASEVNRVAIETGAHAVTADASNAHEVREALAGITAQFGGLDAIIHCAGSVAYGDVQSTTDLQWAEMLSSNLTSVFVTSREALPDLVARKGSIVIISSIAGLEAMPQAAGYVAAKHGVIGLARSLAFDFGPKGVRVNTICPGWVRTPMADREMQAVMEAKGLTLDGAYDLVTCDTPLRRAGTPSEIAALCRFLIDDESSIITGAVIPADAGATIVCAPTIRL